MRYFETDASEPKTGLDQHGYYFAQRRTLQLSCNIGSVSGLFASSQHKYSCHHTSHNPEDQNLTTRAEQSAASHLRRGGKMCGDTQVLSTLALISLCRSLRAPGMTLLLVSYLPWNFRLQPIIRKR
jgi:hypothetical protein